MTALRNADAAGDTAAATRIAAMIKEAEAVEEPVSVEEPSSPESLGVGGAMVGAADIVGSGVAGAAEDVLAGYAGMIGGRNVEQAADIMGAVKEGIPDYQVGEKGQQVAQMVAKAYEDYVPENVKGLITEIQSAPEDIFQQGMDTASRLREKGYDTLAGLTEFGTPIAATAVGAIPTAAEGLGAVKIPSVIGKTAAATQRVASPEKREIAKQLEAIEGEYLPNGEQPTGTDVATQPDPWTQGQPQVEDELGLEGYTTTTAPYKLNKYGKVIDNPRHKIASDAGFSDSILGLIERANPETRARFTKMVNNRERLYELPETADVNDPSIVTGESLGKRLDVVKKVNKDSGKAIDKYVNNQLANVEVNTMPLMDRVSELWGEKGINLDAEGNVDFGKLNLNKKGQTVISDILDEMKEFGTERVTAKNVHDLKRRIDEDITYGKDVTGLDAKTQGLLNDFRGSVKGFLEDQFPEYGRANAEYSQSVDVINRIQKAAGKVDLEGEYSMANLGRMSRAIMSQRVSRDEIMTAIKDLDAISAQNGKVFKDDLRMQVHLANTLDDIWGPSRGTGFAGQSKQGAASAIAETSIDPTTGVAAVGKKAIDALKKKQLDDKKKFKAMRELLKPANQN
jgi:hypothetical protein